MLLPTCGVAKAPRVRTVSLLAVFDQRRRLAYTQAGLGAAPSTVIHHSAGCRLTARARSLSGESEAHTGQTEPAHFEHQGVAQPEERQSGGLEAAGAVPATLTSAIPVRGGRGSGPHDPSARNSAARVPTLDVGGRRCESCRADRLASQCPRFSGCSSASRAPVSGTGGRRGGTCHPDSRLASRVSLSPSGCVARTRVPGHARATAPLPKQYPPRLLVSTVAFRARKAGFDSRGGCYRSDRFALCGGLRRQAGLMSLPQRVQLPSPQSGSSSVCPSRFARVSQPGRGSGSRVRRVQVRILSRAWSRVRTSGKPSGEALP